MIKLSNILLELDMGKYPLTDPDDPSIVDKDMVKYLAKKYSYEANTEDERRFLKGLKDFIDSHNTTGLKADDLKAFLRIKDKFPEILRPNVKSVYRGASLDIDLLRGGGVSIKQVYPNLYEVFGIKEITSRVSSGYLSFSTSYDIANDFASYEVTSVILDERLPAIYEVSGDDPHLLFNENLMNAIGEISDEDEVLYVGTTFYPKKVFIPFNKSIKSNIRSISDKLPYITKVLFDKMKVSLDT